MNSLAKALLSTLLLTTSTAALSAGDAHHYPGIFLGYTNAGSETHFTYGIEYEYKFNKSWGLGAIYEETDDAHDGDGITVKLAELFYHPMNNVRIGAGVGKEKIGGSSHSEDLYRVSANYEFHVGDFGIEPTFAVDFIDGEEAYVLGVAFIRPF